MALRGCNKSLKSVRIAHNQMEGEQLVDIIAALITHSQLEELELAGVNMRRNECMTLAALLCRCTTTELHKLSICVNSIGVKGQIFWRGFLPIRAAG